MAASRPTLPYTAVISNHQRTLMFCLRHGWDIDSILPLGQMSLTLLARNFLPRDAVGAAKFLLENGADVNAVNSGGLTALHEIAGCWPWDYDHVFLELLLTNGADPDKPDVNGLTPLHYAAARDNYRALEAMLAASESHHSK